jgi:hypothetical protein
MIRHAVGATVADLDHSASPSHYVTIHRCIDDTFIAADIAAEQIAPGSSTFGDIWRRHSSL